MNFSQAFKRLYNQVNMFDGGKTWNTPTQQPAQGAPLNGQAYQQGMNSAPVGGQNGLQFNTPVNGMQMRNYGGPSRQQPSFVSRLNTRPQVGPTNTNYGVPEDFMLDTPYGYVGPNYGMQKGYNPQMGLDADAYNVAQPAYYDGGGYYAPSMLNQTSQPTQVSQVDPMHQMRLKVLQQVFKTMFR